MQQRRITSRGLVQQYLDRIEKYEDRLNAIITLNPRALDEADARDRERADGKVRGPLHGIPIALKDNIHTTGLPTTGGALAFKGFVPPYDATVTKNLRDAGAIVIAKTNMTELANWIATGMPGNYSAIAGYGFNPVRSAVDDPPTARATNDGDGPALSAGRVELGRRNGGEFLGSECRHRDVGLDPHAGQSDHARRHQADGWPHQPLRHYSDYGRSGYGRPDGENRRRRSAPARSARRRGARSSRPGDQGVPSARRTETTRDFSTRERSPARASGCHARRLSTKGGMGRCCAMRSRCSGSTARRSSIPRTFHSSRRRSAATRMGCEGRTWSVRPSSSTA